MEHTLKQLKDNWVILMAILALIVSWTTNNSRLVEAESDIQDLKIIVSQINEMNVTIREIKTDVSWIKSSLIK